MSDIVLLAERKTKTIYREGNKVVKRFNENYSKADVACSFQCAAVDVLVEKTVAAAREKGVSTVTVGGGVAANGYLRRSLQVACEKNGLRLVLPEKRYCTDNAAMIASEGLIQYRLGNFADMTLTAKASIPLEATLETVQSRKDSQDVWCITLCLNGKGYERKLQQTRRYLLFKVAFTVGLAVLSFLVGVLLKRLF